MKRTLLALMIAGLFAGIGPSAMAQDAAAKEATTAQTPGTDSNAQQPAEPADPGQSNATKAPQAKSEEGSAGKKAEAGATAAPSEEYTAALKKCDALTGNEKSECVDAAKKKYGQM